jgi:hypothetical protein
MHVANLAQTSTIDGALELWHRRLGHLNIKGVHVLQHMVSGMNLGNMPCPTSSFVCDISSKCCKVFKCGKLFLFLKNKSIKVKVFR